MVPTSIVRAAQVLAGLLLASPVKGQLNKPLISPEFPPLGLNLMNALTPTQSTRDSWEWGYVPRWCKQEATRLGFSPYDLTVFNIHYTDCNDVWIMCKHKDTPTAQIDMVDRFGRMPVKMRNYIRHVLALPGGTGAHTFSGTGDMVMFGNVREPQAQTLWVHETAHSIDWHNGPNGAGDFSSTQPWLTAYAQDPAISDDYARSSQAENFAQSTVLALYDREVPGGIGPTNPSWHQVEKQIRAVQTKLGDQLVQGGRCSRGTVGICDTIVCMGPAATNCLNAGTPANKKRGVLSYADVPINRTVEAVEEASYRGPDLVGEGGDGVGVGGNGVNCTSEELKKRWVFGSIY